MMVTIKDGSMFNGQRAMVERKWIERYDNGNIEELGVIVLVKSIHTERSDGMMEWGLAHGEYTFN